jgi:hypothetical protein
VLQTAGAPNWPVSAGDEIVTGTAGAVLVFEDGARIAMAPHTKLILQQCDRCIAQLFYGAVDYHKPADSKLEFCALGRPVRPDPGTDGSVTVVGSDKVIVKVAGQERVITTGSCPCDAGAPWVLAKAGMSSATKIAIITAGTAAAAGTAVAVTRPPKKSKDKDKD